MNIQSRFMQLLKSSKRASLLVITALCVISITPEAKAWNELFHKWVTYMMCIRMGYTPEAADVISSGVNYVDVMPATNPFTSAGMHFESDKAVENTSWYKALRVRKSSNRAMAPKALGGTALMDSDLANIIIQLHFIQDLHPHAGFIKAGLINPGHAVQDSWPDYPWASEANQTNFKESLKLTAKYLASLRQIMPKSALVDGPNPYDAARGLKTDYESAEYVQELVNEFLAFDPKNPGANPLERLWRHDYHKDPRYIEGALTLLAHHMKEKGWLNTEVSLRDILPPGYELKNGEKTAQEVIVDLIVLGQPFYDNSGKALFTEKLVSAAFPGNKDIHAVIAKKEKELRAEFNVSTEHQYKLDAEKERLVAAAARNDIANAIMKTVSTGFIPSNIYKPNQEKTQEVTDTGDPELGALLKALFENDIHDIVKNVYTVDAPIHKIRSIMNFPGLEVIFAGSQGSDAATKGDYAKVVRALEGKDAAEAKVTTMPAGGARKMNNAGWIKKFFAWIYQNHPNIVANADFWLDPANMANYVRSGVVKPIPESQWQSFSRGADAKTGRIRALAERIVGTKKQNDAVTAGVRTLRGEVMSCRDILLN